MTENYDQFKACIKIVMTQTDYDEETATKKLKEWDNDFIKVIKEYLNPNFNAPKKEKKTTLNQRIIGEIRKFKDKQDENYLNTKREKDRLKFEIMKRENELAKAKEIEKIAEESNQEDISEPSEKINIDI